MVTIEEEVERLQWMIERLGNAIKKAKALLDEHYSDNRLERYERLCECKYEVEGELEVLTDDTFDGDPEDFRPCCTYAPMEGFFYG